MRVALLLIVCVGVYAVSAEYLSDNGHNSLSFDSSKEDKSNQVDLWETRNQTEIQKQLKHNEKEGRNHEEEQEKYKEKFAVEKKLTKKKQLEKQTLKKWKRTQEEKLETERKRKERLSRIETILNRLENDSNDKRKHVTVKRGPGSIYDDYFNVSVEHANWKNYVYKKYGLTELSGSVEKKAALIRYVEEVLLDPNARGTEAPAFRDSVSALESTALVDSTATPPVAAASDTAPAPVAPYVPEAPRAQATHDAAIPLKVDAAVETSTVRSPAVTPDNSNKDYPYLFPYKPY